MAGSRIGVRGGSDRNVRGGGVSRVSIETVSAPSLGSGSAQVWQQLAQLGSNIHSKAHSIYDKEAAVEGELRGTYDALSGKIDVNANRSTTRGAAYVKAAVDASMMQMDANASMALLEAFMNNPNDPQAILGMAKSYSEGASAELMKIDPRAAVAVQARMATLARPLINSAINNKEQRIVEQKKFAREQAEAAYTETIASVSDHIFSDDPEEAAAAMRALGQAYQGKKQSFEVDQAETFLMGLLPDAKTRSHVTSMDDDLKVRLANMIAAAPPDIAAKIGIMSGYRSPQHQAVLYANAVKKYGSESAARKWVAPPGKSNHNHGFAADLTYAGKSLASAPASVQKWVKENAPSFGLKLPLANEPWHIETQETRGGVPYVQPVGAKATTGTGIAFDQNFYDGTIKAGYKAWFAKQGDQIGAYMQLQNGEAVLETFEPNGNAIAINIRDRLSDAAYEALLGDLRQQINFTNGIKAAQAKAEDDAAKALSDNTRAGFMTGILMAGQEVDLGDGKKVVIEKPTPQELLEAFGRRELDHDNYEYLLKQLTVEASDTSNSDVVKEAQTMILFNGEDAKDFLLKNKGQISAVDMRTLFNLNKAEIEEAEILTPNQKEYKEYLRIALSETGPLGALDASKQERLANAMIEYSRRVREGEPAEDVYNDVLKRASSIYKMDMGEPGAGQLKPRFFVPMEGQPGFIDPGLSAAALDRARATGEISDTAFARQEVLLARWIIDQQRLMTKELESKK